MSTIKKMKAAVMKKVIRNIRDWYLSGFVEVGKMVEIGVNIGC